MTVFLKVKKKSTFYPPMLYGFAEIKDNIFTIRCTIKFNMKFINIVLHISGFFSLKSGLK
jgi:hypothetical protein